MYFILLGLAFPTTYVWFWFKLEILYSIQIAENTGFWDEKLQNLIEI